MSSVETIARMWRHDGVINYMVPPELAASTFVVLAAAHSSWLCLVLEDMARTLSPSDLRLDVAEQFHVDIEALAEATMKQHKSEAYESRMKRGTEDTFNGWLYGTMHPAELSALADDLALFMGVFSMQDQGEAGRSMMNAWGLWIEGAKKFVRPSESIAPAVQNTVKQ